MQRFKYLLLVGVSFLVSIYLGGCENAPGPDTRLDLAAGSGLTTENKTVSAGEIINVSLYGRSTNDNKFKKFTITYNYDSTTNVVYLDSVINTSEFSTYFSFGARAIPKNERWIFTLQDEKNNTYTKQFILKTTGGVFPFHNYSSSYYRQNNYRNLQYFAVEDGTIYPGYTLKNTVNPKIKEKVSFGFVPDITAPNDTLVDLISANETKFKATSLGLTDFNAIASTADLKSRYDGAATPEVTRLPKIKENQVIAFKTKAGKSGLILINAFDTVEDLAQKKFVLQRMRFQVKAEK